MKKNLLIISIVVYFYLIINSNYEVAMYGSVKFGTFGTLMIYAYDFILKTCN